MKELIVCGVRVVVRDRENQALTYYSRVKTFDNVNQMATGLAMLGRTAD
jgi:hypothetical protein